MMSKDDLKQIGNLIKPLNSQFDEFAKLQKRFEKELGEVKSELGEVKIELKEVAETTNANNGSLINLEKDIKIYNDSLDVERKRIDKHEKRLTRIEAL